MISSLFALVDSFDHKYLLSQCSRIVRSTKGVTTTLYQTVTQSKPVTKRITATVSQLVTKTEGKKVTVTITSYRTATKDGKATTINQTQAITKTQVGGTITNIVATVSDHTTISVVNQGTTVVAGEVITQTNVVYQDAQTTIY